MCPQNRMMALSSVSSVVLVNGASGGVVSGAFPRPAGEARTGGTYGNNDVSGLQLATGNGPSLPGCAGLLAGVRAC